MATIRSQGELAKLLGVSQQAVSKLVRGDGWPAKRRGPWSAEEVGAIIRWHQGTQEDRAAPDAQQSDLSNAVKQMRVLLMKSQRETHQLKNELLRGQLVQRDMLDGALGGLTEQFLLVLDQIRLTFPRRFGIDGAELDRAIAPFLKQVSDRAEIELRSLDEVLTAARKRRGKRAS